MHALQKVNEDSFKDESIQKHDVSSSSRSEISADFLTLISGKRNLDSPFGWVTEDDIWASGGADSSSIYHRAQPLEIVAETDYDMSTADQISLVVHTLGLSKRHLGELFGVSRQAIYDWLKGETVSNKNASKLSELARMLVPITTNTRRPLYHRFTTEQISADDPSILDLLREKSLDTGRISQLLQKAREMTTQRQERPGVKRSQVSQSQADENLLDNLRSLGEG